MELIIIITAISQSIGVSLGIGGSVLAVTNFFVALSDGHIDTTERKMMGIVYIILRIAMTLILFTTGLLTFLQYKIYGLVYFTPFVVGFWILIFILFINAILMTLKIMPYNFGPALQAATWFSLGIMLALFSLNLYLFSFIQLVLGMHL